MKTSSRLLPALMLSGVVLVAVPAWALSSTDQPAPQDAKTPPVASSGAKGELEKGMTGDQVVALIGKPATVEKMKTDEPKAEKWIYRRATAHRVEQQAMTVANEDAFIGTGGANNNTLGTRPVIQYGLKHIDTYRVTALLMVDNKLVVAKQWNEQRVSYEQ
ncbi:MAG TPA: hypothetical protein VHD32_09055 [Candidatus Didemnitutus sp.]|nr:hypothetical protein [Candidatus Didemnitutus sp.]